ncbi:MAG: hypothetical protein EOP05_11380 [Proteobacteria bacterium]|nr:MAG: hypothetical protein EOP05_11380 [Pseudomonadota bacterium]
MCGICAGSDQCDGVGGALPEIEKKIESGELSLTAAAKVQSFFRAEKKAKKVYSEKEKLDVVRVCLSKSTREVERELASRNPEVSRVESVKPVGKDSFELRLTISAELELKLRKLKALLAHTKPNLRTEQLLGILVEIALDKFDPVRKAERAEVRAERKANSQLRAHETTGACESLK